jgi:FkbM family methyltransferase
MDKKIIFDVGLHKGEDTEYYLTRGFRVVAIEADPDLVSFCKTKFKKFIDAGTLEIIHGAVVEDDSKQSIKFYKNNKVSVWGTVVKSWADRNAMLGADSVEIEVPVVHFKELFSQYGCPYYLKIDIEGMDLVCLKKLFYVNFRPKYVSIESQKINFSSLLDEFAVFLSLGYIKFFIQQQSDISSSLVPPNSTEGKYIDYKFPSGSTGMFGSDLGPNWLSKDEALLKYEDIFKDYLYYGDHSLLRNLPLGKYLLHALSKVARRPLPGWYDTHASI